MTFTDSRKIVARAAMASVSPAHQGLRVRGRPCVKQGPEASVRLKWYAIEIDASPLSTRCGGNPYPSVLLNVTVVLNSVTVDFSSVTGRYLPQAPRMSTQRRIFGNIVYCHCRLCLCSTQGAMRDPVWLLSSPGARRTQQDSRFHPL